MAVPHVASEPVAWQAPPLPGFRIMHQQWRDASFLHWRVEPSVVAPLLPPGTRPDVFDGTSWVGLIPFRMVGAGIGRGPSIPWLGTFAETNVRLYSVDGTGRRGVVFRSLEASRLAVVLGARAAFGLPYEWARMSIRVDGDLIRYATARLWPGPHRAGGRIVVRPGERLDARDPLADFLTGRWGLHSRWVGRNLYVPNNHEPWPLQRATLVDLDDSLVAAAGLPGIVDRPPDSVLFSAGVTTVFGMPRSAQKPRLG
ncbi:MAG: hypothetical protein JWN20_7 [Jatrophihabitantaceae bacterium]|nr:hypothetical protein [Jatrophihabitantaceae bacterium]